MPKHTEDVDLLGTWRVVCPLGYFGISHGVSKRIDLSSDEKKQLLKKQIKELRKGIELPNGVVIKRITAKEADFFEDASNSTIFNAYDPPVEGEPFLDLSVHAPFKSGPDPVIAGFKAINNVVLAMRLLKGGDVFGKSMLCIHMAHTPPEVTHYSHMNSTIARPLPWFSHHFVLQFSELDALREIVSKISRLEATNRGHMHLACTRFLRSYNEENDDDRLIDLMIGFEALGLKGEQPGSSQRERIATGCAVLLGNNDEERESIRQLLNDAYELRNLIVHGATSPKLQPQNLVQLHEIVNKVEDLLRQSIKKYL